jgi:hypothetical protein
MAYDFLGYIYQDLNLHQAALDAHTTGLNTALTGKVGFWMPRLSANVAITRLRLGDLSAASDLEVAFAVAMEDYQRFHAVRALEGLLEAGILCGDPASTLHYAELLEGMCQMGGLRELQVQVHRWRCAAYRLLGQSERAAQELQKAQNEAASITRPRLHWELHTEAADLATMQGDLAQAAVHQRAMNAIAQAIAGNLQDPTLCRGILQPAIPA